MLAEFFAPDRVSGSDIIENVRHKGGGAIAVCKVGSNNVCYIPIGKFANMDPTLWMFPYYVISWDPIN